MSENTKEPMHLSRLAAEVSPNSRRCVDCGAAPGQVHGKGCPYGAVKCPICQDQGYVDNGNEPSFFCECPAGRRDFHNTLRAGASLPPEAEVAGKSVLKDSGERVKFDTGAVRDSNRNKGRFDLVPPFPEQQQALHYEHGALKYEDRNWEKGIKLGRMLDSAIRHLNQWRQGLRDEPHLVAAVWNLNGLIHFLHEISEGRLPKELDDHNYTKDGEFPSWGYLGDK